MLYEKNLTERDIEHIQKFIAPIQIEIDLEGNANRNGMLVLGCRAGPCRDVENVLHELGHFIEIDDARMTLKGWGFKYGKWVENPFPRGYSPSGWHEFSTDQHIQREIRVWAFQANLHRHFGLPVSFEEFGKVAQYLPDFFHYKKGNTDKERSLHIAREIESKAEQVEYSFHTLFTELQRKKAKLTLTN